MDALKEWIVKHRFEQFLDGLVTRQGVGAVEELNYVTTADVKDLGFMPVQQRCFEMLVAAIASRPSVSSPAAVLDDERHPAPALPRRSAPLDGDPAGSALPQNLAQRDAGGNAMEQADVMVQSRLVSRASRGATTRTENEANGATCQSDSEETGSCDSSSAMRALALTASRQPSANGLSSQASVCSGTAQLSRAATLTSGSPAGSPTGRRGQRQWTRARRGRAAKVYAPAWPCCNRGVSTSRAVHEKHLSGGKGTVYNYARLWVAVVNMLLDGRGNWVVHEKCARNYLGVSNWWLANRHKESIRATQSATMTMTKSQVAASHDPDALLSRIFLPDSCLLTVLQYYISCPMTTRLELTFNASDHGRRASHQTG